MTKGEVSPSIKMKGSWMNSVRGNVVLKDTKLLKTKKGGLDPKKGGTE